MSGELGPQHGNGHQPQVYALALAGGDHDARTARNAARQFFGGRLQDGRCEEAVLMVSELITNSVMHARTPPTMRMRLDSQRLRVEVEDAHPALPAVRDPDSSSERGRGLLLVESLASRWGVSAAPPGKIVWFEVDL